MKPYSYLQGSSILADFCAFFVHLAKDVIFFGGFMSEQKYDRDGAIALLKNKSEELSRAGEQRFPCRSDFSEDEVNAIKSFLGPWPRALEAAGLKEAREDGRAEKLLEKRIRAKRARTEEKIARKQNKN